MVDSLLKALMVASAVAAVASIIAILLGVTGAEAMTFVHAILLIGPGVVAFIGFFVLQLIAQNRYGTKPFRKLLESGAPRELRWLCNGLSIAGFVLWFYWAFTKYDPPSGEISSVLAGTFGLFVFPACFLTFYSYIRVRPELRKRCSQGHEVPFEASFCPQCGERVRPVG